MINSLSTLFDRLSLWSDQFDGQTSNTPEDLVDVPGEHDFSPERIRYYKNGSRRFLQYGTDANYTETARGRTLAPDSDQTLTINTAERAAYPVGADLWPSMSYSVNQPPQAGDAIGGGYGIIDLANFDPATVSYDAGSTADGWFWYHTADTGLSECILAGVGDGSIYYDTQVPVYQAADVLAIMETRLNWYGVGPGKTIRSYTDIANHPNKPMQNKVLGHVANDSGPSSVKASHRAILSIYQAAGNSGLELTAGSMSVWASSTPNYAFKAKGHEMSLDNTNTTAGTYQVLGAIRPDPTREAVKLRFTNIDITQTPGTETNNTEVLVVAVDPSNTNAPAGGSWDTPVEHNPTNSVVEQVTVAGDATTPLTGPDQAGAGTDIDGADTSNTVTNPGGYQMARETVGVEGTGGKTESKKDEQTGDRELYDTDYALFLVDSDTAGTLKVQVSTEQNS